MDPRLAVIDQRLAPIDRIVAVTGGKGGIGKSLVATTLALTLSDAGHAVGLLDLDLTSPSDHLILGCDPGFPDEQFGIEPADASGVRFLSLTCFSGSTPAPLRGADVTNAFLEMLAITRWGALDVLLVDMPPGLGDATLDAVRLVPRASYLFVATSSRVVLGSVERTLRLHTDLRTDVIGVVENMQRGASGRVRELAENFDTPYLGALPFDETVEVAIGDPDSLVQSEFARAVRVLHGAVLG